MAETKNLVDTPEAQEAFLTDIPVPTETKVTPVKTDVLSDKSYTEEDLRRVREQEKSKLYPQIDSIKEEVNLLKKDREERVAQVEAEKAAAEEENRKKTESEMDIRQLLEIKEKEWAQKLETERGERERAFTLLERERQYAELSEYRTRRLEDERDNIMPELVDLISGNTPDEIENSITGLRERSSRILESAQSAMQNARKEMKGTSITTPPAGPLETNSEQRTLTAQEIAAMPMNEYAKIRDRIMSDSARGKSRGLFG
jgi:hypothetical protein